MIYYKTPEEISEMRESCQLAAKVLNYIESYVQVGVSCNELNDLCHKFIIEHKATPSPLGYRGFPKSICTSVNDVVCHGIPNDYKLKDGDIINLDITTYMHGYHGDTSKTFHVGKTSRSARDLVKSTYDSLWLGILNVKPGGHIGDIGAEIESFVKSKGYTVVREYCGHGIGKNFHEDPHVTHFGRKGTGALIKPGMVFTIEPMVNMGKADVFLEDDNWTVRTNDGKLSAQFEHTIAVFEDRVEVLTIREEENRDAIVWRKGS